MYRTFLFTTLFLIYTIYADKPFPVSDYNLVWYSPSVNSSGSMILGSSHTVVLKITVESTGNGEIGINLWIEESTGDILFYLSRTDTWSENGRLLKVGKVRVSLEPNYLYMAKVISASSLIN
jgi:alpha-L-fucosidase 2